MACNTPEFRIIGLSELKEKARNKGKVKRE